MNNNNKNCLNISIVVMRKFKIRGCDAHVSKAYPQEKNYQGGRGGRGLYIISYINPNYYKMLKHFKFSFPVLTFKVMFNFFLFDNYMK
jgi:hypothetical protein